jgi:hypothetical protein
MKILKPSYDSSTKVYTCEIADGFRLTVSKEDGVVKPAVEDLTRGDLYDGVIDTLIKGTKGWFSKPLTQDWLQTRVKFDIPIGEVEAEFEWTVDFQVSRLIISKEVFLFQCPIVRKQEAEKVVISFEEAEQAEAAQAEAGPAEPELVQGEAVGIGPTRRILQKEVVMKARNKAARALFSAERMTQEFVEEFGDTDWEDESDLD